MSALSAYHKVAGNLKEEEKPELPDKPENHEDAARAQMRFNWLQSTITKEFLDGLNKEIEMLEEQARNTAMNCCGNAENKERVVQLLVRSQTLRNLIKLCQLK